VGRVRGEELVEELFEHLSVHGGKIFLPDVGEQLLQVVDREEAEGVHLHYAAEGIIGEELGFFLVQRAEAAGAAWRTPDKQHVIPETG
jgi:hypothetical protein